MFSPIARGAVDRGQYDEAIFLDLFAGCGATLLPTKDWLPGSPIIAAHAKKLFDKVICVEASTPNCVSLRQRLAQSGVKNPIVINGDCNQSVAQIAAAIRSKNPLIFAFVDPEGMEIQWDTMEALAQQYGAMDLLINLTHGAQREMGAVVSTGKSVDSLETFTGARLEEVIAMADGRVSDFYKARVQEVLGKKFGDSTPVYGEGRQLKYHLQIYTRETGGESPFRKGYFDIHRRLDGMTTEHVQGALNSIKGRGLFRLPKQQ